MIVPISELPINSLPLRAEFFEMESIFSALGLLFLCIVATYFAWKKYEAGLILESKKYITEIIPKKEIVSDIFLKEKLEKGDWETEKGLAQIELFIREYITYKYSIEIPSSATLSEVKTLPFGPKKALSILRDARYGNQQSRLSGKNLKGTIISILFPSSTI